jgi:hypothetical protein
MLWKNSGFNSKFFYYSETLNKKIEADSGSMNRVGFFVGRISRRRSIKTLVFPAQRRI